MARCKTHRSVQQFAKLIIKSRWRFEMQNNSPKPMIHHS